MTINIRQTVWGFQVAIDSPVRERLAEAVEALKAAVPRNCRRYQPAGRYWFIDQRAERWLRQWLDAIRRRLADVEVFEQRDRA